MQRFLLITTLIFCPHQLISGGGALQPESKVAPPPYENSTRRSPVQWDLWDESYDKTPVLEDGVNGAKKDVFVINGDNNCVCYLPIDVSIAPVIKRVKVNLKFLLGCFTRDAEDDSSEEEKDKRGTARRGCSGRLRPLACCVPCFGTTNREIVYGDKRD